MPAGAAATGWPEYLSRRTLGVERALWLVWATTIVVYAPSLAHATFLSDDVAILGGIHAWQHAGQLWSRVAALFFERLPTGNHYYRPLPFVSFALDYTVVRREGDRLACLQSGTAPPVDGLCVRIGEPAVAPVGHVFGTGCIRRRIAVRSVPGRAGSRHLDRRSLRCDGDGRGFVIAVPAHAQPERA